MPRIVLMMDGTDAVSVSGFILALAGPPLFEICQSSLTEPLADQFLVFFSVLAGVGLPLLCMLLVVPTLVRSLFLRVFVWHSFHYADSSVFPMVFSEKSGSPLSCSHDCQPDTNG